jgi:hypothetical protein
VHVQYHSRDGLEVSRVHASDDTYRPRCLVKINSDVIRTSLLTFFNNRALDMKAAVDEYHLNGQYSAIRCGFMFHDN